MRRLVESAGEQTPWCIREPLRRTLSMESVVESIVLRDNSIAPRGKFVAPAGKRIPPSGHEACKKTLPRLRAGHGPIASLHSSDYAISSDHKGLARTRRKGNGDRYDSQT